MTIALIVLIILIIIMLVLGFFALIMILSTIIGVPFVPTKLADAIKMIELAEIKPGQTVIDLGSGAGRLLFLSAQKGANAIGYELNPFLIFLTRLIIRVKGLKGQIKVINHSIYSADLSQADVVLAFLMPGPMKKLAPKFIRELKPGAKVVSYSFSWPGKEPSQKVGKIFVYEI